MTAAPADWAGLGRIIAERRRALGLAKNAAARRARVSNTTWTRLERGHNHRPTDATLARVARAVEVDPAVLFEAAARPVPAPVEGALPADGEPADGDALAGGVTVAQMHAQYVRMLLDKVAQLWTGEDAPDAEYVAALLDRVERALRLTDTDRSATPASLQALAGGGAVGHLDHHSGGDPCRRPQGWGVSGDRT